MFTPLALAALALLAPLQQERPAAGQVRGLVRSDATGERLPYSVVEIVGSAGSIATLADSAGAYVLRDVPPGPRILRVSRFDHAPLEVEVLVPAGRSVTLDVMLVRRPVQLPGITASVARRPALADTVNPPAPELSIAATRALESTPGVSELGLGQVSRGAPAQEPADPSDVLYVRGAPADLKLVLLDGAPVYAPFHLGGLIQAFDPKLLRSADLYLGGAPARYDGGLSYVLGLETRAGRRTAFRTSGAADLLSTRVRLEGPLTGRAGFLLAGRSIHARGAGLFLDHAFPYDYADVLGRIDADVGDAGGIALTGFWNREEVRLDGARPVADVAAWGNGAASLRYRGPLAGGDAEFTAAYGTYRAVLPLGGTAAVDGDGRARRVRLSADLTRGGETTRVQYGLSYERLMLDYRVLPRVPDGDVQLLETSASGEVAGGYLDVDWRLAARWRVRGGGRVDIFSYDGVPRFAPRISLTWAASDRAALTVAAGRYRQLIRASDPVLVTDEDSAQSVYAPPPLGLAHASHFVLGLDQDLGDGLRLGIEGFYKTFDDVPRTDTAVVDATDGAVQTLRTTAARASGVDLWLRRSDGDLTGWLGYSLAWVWSTERSAAAERFAGRQILSLGLSGALGDRGRFDLRIGFGSELPYAAIPQVHADGPVTLDAASTSDMQEFRSVTLNAPPLTAAPDDPYLRVDLEVSRPWKGRWGGRSFTLTPYIKVLNALDRRDALFYRVRGDRGEPDPLAALPLLPVLGFHWAF